MFLVTLPTVAACPSNKEEKDSGPCFAKDPETGAHFNLSSLSKPEGYEVKNLQSHDTYLINVCQPLGDGAPNKCRGLGVCDLSSNGTSANLGFPSSNLKIASDFEKLKFKNKLQLVYEAHDESCPNGILRTELGFYCREKEGLGPFLYPTFDRCYRKVMWITPQACPIGTHVYCEAYDALTGATYDLSSLVLENNDYHVYLNSPFKYPRIVFNVCRSLVRNYPVADCQWTDGACMITDKQWHVSFGDPSSPKYENNSLTITYNSSQSCILDDSLNSSLIVQFECDPNAFNTKPYFLYMTRCSYHLNWKSAAACALPNYKTSSELINPHNPATGHVYYMNPVEFSNFTISLDPLTKIQIELWPKNGTGTTACGPDTAVCHIKNAGTKAQMATPLGSHKGVTLHYEEGILIYIFPTNTSSGGYSPSLCHSAVHIICRNISEAESRPFLVSNSSCRYEFIWPTQAVCESRVECEVSRKGNTFDLRPIINIQSNFEVLDPVNESISYYLSLCGPLAPLPETAGCPSNAAACLVDKKTNHSLSLGYAGRSFKFDEDEHAYLIYYYGESCSESKQYSTKITFLCDPLMGKGYPTFTLFNATACMVSFEWRTSFICTKDELNQALSYPDRCKYYDPIGEVAFDLGQIPANNYTKSNGETLMLHPCGAFSKDPYHPCFGASICLSTKDGLLKPFGSFLPTFSFDDRSIEVEYFDGAQCADSERDGRTTALITFECSSGNEVTWQRHGECRVYINYKTFMACRPSKYRCSIPQALPYNLRPFISDSHAWSTVDMFSNRYYTNLCAPLDGSFSKCPPSSAICMYNASSGEYQSIGNLYYQDRKIVRSRASDGMRIFGTIPVPLIEYMENATCLGNRPFSSKIYIECDYKTHASLTFRSRPDACTFEFEFKTNHACKGRDLKIPAVSGDSTSNHYFRITLGAEQTEEDCLGASLCEINNTTPIIKRNIGLYYRKSYRSFGSIGSYQSSLAILARGDDRCHSAPGRFYYSHIHLVCLRYARSGKPKFLYMDKGCTYYFEWATDQICENNAKKMNPKRWTRFVKKLQQNLYTTTPSTTKPTLPTGPATLNQDKTSTSQPSSSIYNISSSEITHLSLPPRFKSTPFLIALYATLGMIGCIGLGSLGVYLYNNNKNPYRRSLFWTRVLPCRKNRQMYFYKNVNSFDDTLMDTFNDDTEPNEL